MSSAHNENQALLTAVLEMSEMHLGKENLHSLAVRLFPMQSRAIVWAELVANTMSAQLDAIESFWEVRECYASELEIELRFGNGDDAELNVQEESSALLMTR